MLGLDLDIKDVLDYSKIMNNKSRKVIDQNLNEVIQFAFKRVAYDLLDKPNHKVELMWNIPSNVPTDLSEESGVIREILTTILRNSCKHMEEGVLSLACDFVIR
jgi:signal transduction histidine kinase